MDSCSVNSSSVTSPVSSLNDEPHRVKFLCSFLGSILPRPQDGKLRYVGGETRIVSVSRDIRYEELMSKMRELYDGAAVLKYQQPDEDLDALVSVVNDDDVTNMMEEYDKLGSGDGFTRLRIFLFSSPEQDGSSHFVDRDDQRESERRYVDALNNLIEGTDFRKLQQHPDSPRFNPIDDFSMVEPMLNQLSIDTGGGGSQRGNEIPVAQYSNLHQLRIPRVGSGQMLAPRYGEVEGTWSPYYSPRHHGHHDPRTFQEFPSSPSSARYRMPYGEIPDKGFDRMPEEYVRPSQASHHPLYEHQAQVPDNVVWVPAGAMPPESKGGFPGNVLHGGPGGYEGGNVCENCRGTFHRNHQLLEQPNVGNNGFPPVPSAHCAQCPVNRENFLLNTDPKPIHHGAYPNETFGHERGWMVQQQVNPNPNPLRMEDGRPYISNVGRPSDHYTLDSPGMNYPLGHRAGTEFPSEGFHDKPIGGIPLNLSNPSAEERGFRYGNNLYAPGPESIPSAGHSHMHPQQNIWQNVSNPIAAAPGLPMQVNGTVNQTVIRNPIETAPRYSIGVENQSVLVGSPQKISGFDGMSSPGQPYYPNPQFQDRAVPLDPNWVPSEIPVVHNEYLQVFEPLPGPLLQTNLNAAPVAQTPDCIEVARPVESKVAEGGEQFNYVDASYLEKPQPLAEGKNDMGNLVKDSPSAAPPEGAELSVERLSFLPELIESVKRAALEGAAEVKAHPEEANDPVRPELVENESEHVVSIMRC